MKKLFLLVIFVFASQAKSYDNSDTVCPQAVNNIAAQVKSKQELYSLGHSAIDALSPESKKIFLGSLRFSEKGLSSYNYRVLEEELNITEIYRILTLFGLQHNIKNFDGARVETEQDEIILNSKNSLSQVCGSDRPNYRCVSNGTCQYSNGFICTYNC